MPYLEIPADLVFIEATGSIGHVVIVGGSTAVSERDDATYVEIPGRFADNYRANVRFPATALPDNTVPDVVDLVYRQRSVTTTRGGMLSYYSHPETLTGFGSAFMAVTAPADDFAEFVYTDLPNVTTAMVEAGQVGASNDYDAFGNPTNYSAWLRVASTALVAGAKIQFSYVALRVTLTGGVPPLRVYPRDDGLAASSAPRAFPASKAEQASNRVVGGYL